MGEIATKSGNSLAMLRAAGVPKVSGGVSTAVAPSSKPGDGLSLLKEHWITPQDSDETGSTLVGQEGSQSSKELSIGFGVDQTDSTNEVAGAFSRLAMEISNGIRRKFAGVDQVFGTMSGNGIKFVKQGLKPEDIAVQVQKLLSQPNERGDSNVPKFLSESLDKLEGKTKILFVLSDEIDCYAGIYTNMQFLEKIITRMIKENVKLFFIYTKTGVGGNSKEEIEQALIKPLGENGHLLDMSTVDVSQLVRMISGCVSYSVKQTTKASIPGVPQISLTEHLKTFGVSVPITDGRRLLS